MKKWIAITLGCALLLGGFSYIARAASSDDTGVLLPPNLTDKVVQKANVASVKCEDTYAKAAAALIACYAKCDKMTADRYVKKGDFMTSPKDEETCEAACATKYDKAIAKTAGKGCPACLNATTLFNDASTWAEDNLNRYCDSSTPAIPFP